MISVGHRGLTDAAASRLHRGVDPNLLLGVMLIGLGVGFLSGAFGKGGSAISTPLLHLVGVPAIAADRVAATGDDPVDAARQPPLRTRGPRRTSRLVRIGLLVGLPRRLRRRVAARGGSAAAAHRSPPTSMVLGLGLRVC